MIKMADGGWWNLAACQREDPELFFPVSQIGPARTQEALAKAVCARCGVQQQCLDYALAIDEVHGIWGGTGEDDRRRLRASRADREMDRAGEQA